MSVSSNPNLTAAVSHAVQALGQSSTELGGALATTLRDAAETVAGAAGSAAHSVSGALPDLAAALPATVPFGAARRRRWRPSTGLLVGIGLVGSAAAVAAVVAARRRAEHSPDPDDAASVAPRPFSESAAADVSTDASAVADPAPVAVPASGDR